MKLIHYKIEFRKSTKDTLDGYFITGPGIMGHLFKNTEPEANFLAQHMELAYVEGLNHAR